MRANGLKLALVLPRARLWGWHLVLAKRLYREYTVDIILAPGKPVPFLLRGWLRIESVLFHIPDNARQLDVSAFQGSLCSLPRPSAYACIIDLSNSIISSDGARPVLRVSWDGGDAEWALIGRLLGGQSPLQAVYCQGSAIPLVHSRPGIRRRGTLSAALSAVFERTGQLVARALATLDNPRTVVHCDVTKRPPQFSNRALLRFAAATLKARVYRRQPIPDHWTIALRLGQEPLSGDLSSTEGFVPFAMPRAAFFADPCLFSHEGATFLFAERYDYAARRGSIVWAKLDGCGRPGAYTDVMEGPGHLSYPQLFKHDGGIYMTVESLADRAVHLYRATEFPANWVSQGILLNDVALADPTLHLHAGLWWLFGTAAESQENRNDELLAFYSAHLLGPYTPHPLNPVKSDVCSARPAGRFVVRDGRLFRPAQNSEKWYGESLVWCEVTRLSTVEFQEHVVRQWRGADFGSYRGVHTYTACEGVEAVDLLSVHELEPEPQSGHRAGHHDQRARTLS